MDHPSPQTADRPAAFASDVTGIDRPREDLVSSLNRLLVRALLELGRIRINDTACRLAGEGWAMLRHANPREAERLNGVLHSLTRSRCAPPPNHDNGGD